MDSSRSYLAIDLGASSGRAVLGTLDGDVMRMHEVHRFATPFIESSGHLYWDVDVLWSDIQVGVARALHEAPALRSISVDSWAVDYVPLNAAGIRLRNPYSYRDSRTSQRMQSAIQKAGGAATLYERTGIQFLAFNTLPQIVADMDDEPDIVERTAMRLMIADYFLYRLSGRMVCESTMASTTQLMDIRTGDWARDVIGAIGDEPSRWPDIVSAGAVLGTLRVERVAGSTMKPPVVIATCSHDTAAAVAAVPAEADSEWAFISSGTWSLVGIERKEALLTDNARDAGFTNEAGLDDTIRFLKNRAGMWVLEECRREWEQSGDFTPYESLLEQVARAEPLAHSIDLNAPAFAARGDMVRRVHAACADNGIAMPPNNAALARLILHSLAESNARALDELDAVASMHVDVVHIVGGGARNDLLNQLTADACGRRVVAGPEEATVLGNLLVQARALGDLPRGLSVRDVARRSTQLRQFAPRGASRATSTAGTL